MATTRRNREAGRLTQRWILRMSADGSTEATNARSLWQRRAAAYQHRLHSAADHAHVNSTVVRLGVSAAWPSPEDKVGANRKTLIASGTHQWSLGPIWVCRMGATVNGLCRAGSPPRPTPSSPAPVSARTSRPPSASPPSPRGRSTSSSSPTSRVGPGPEPFWDECSG